MKNLPFTLAAFLCVFVSTLSIRAVGITGSVDAAGTPSSDILGVTDQHVVVACNPFEVGADPVPAITLASKPAVKPIPDGGTPPGDDVEVNSFGVTPTAAADSTDNTSDSSSNSSRSLVAAVAVPEGGSTALLVGAALAGLLIASRRRSVA